MLTLLHAYPRIWHMTSALSSSYMDDDFTVPSVVPIVILACFGNNGVAIRVPSGCVNQISAVCRSLVHIPLFSLVV